MFCRFRTDFDEKVTKILKGQIAQSVEQRTENLRVSPFYNTLNPRNSLILKTLTRIPIFSKYQNTLLQKLLQNNLKMCVSPKRFLPIFEFLQPCYKLQLSNTYIF